MKNSLLVLTSASFLFLAACSPSAPAKKSGGAVFDFTITPEATVSGPALEGSWISDCIRNPLSRDLNRKIRLTVRGAAFEHQQTNFVDSDCHQVSSKEKLVQGSLSFTKDYGNSIYLMKYFIPLSGGTSTWEYRNVSLQAGVLRITDMAITPEDLANEKPAIELRKIEGAPQTPVAPQPPVSQNPTAPANLQTGFYSTDASLNLCDASVSTMSSGDLVLQVYLNMASPCNSRTITFDCQGNTCAIAGSDALRLNMIDQGSFELFVKKSNKRAIYKKLN